MIIELIRSDSTLVSYNYDLLDENELIKRLYKTIKKEQKPPASEKLYSNTHQTKTKKFFSSTFFPFI